MRNLTQHVMRFLKNENLYQKAKEILSLEYYLYDTLIDDIVRYNNLSSINNICTIILNITISNQNWLNYRIDNKVTTNNISLDENYFNIVTPLLKDFLKDHNIEREYIEVIKETQHFDHDVINDNDIDKILRKHQINISRLFSSSKTFCHWHIYDYLVETSHLESWGNISDLWKKYLLNHNVPDLIY